jgi:hypothetical protein
MAARLLSSSFDHLGYFSVLIARPDSESQYSTLAGIVQVGNYPKSFALRAAPETVAADFGQNCAAESTNLQLPRFKNPPTLRPPWRMPAIQGVLP